MSIYIKTKSFLLLLVLVTAVFFVSPPLSASSTVTEHERIITQYINDIRTIQNQVFSLLESIISSPPQDSLNLNVRINFINRQLEALDRNIWDYLNTLPRLSTERRDTLIAFDALHFLENSFYQLTEYIKETDSTKGNLLLEDFYFLRTSTTNTLNRLENIISRQ